MEALIYALFDKTPRAYRGDHIMNIRKKTFECELRFEVNGTVYVINRKGKKNKKGAVRVDVKFWKENDNGKETILNGEDRFSTNANIQMLKRSGFKDVSSIAKFICFEGFLAIK